MPTTTGNTKRKNTKKRVKRTSSKNEMQQAVPQQKRHNRAFEAYYRTQLFSSCAAENSEEADRFFEALKQPAPMVLRVQQTQPPAIRAATVRALKQFGGGLRPLVWMHHLSKTGTVQSFDKYVAWQCSHKEYHNRIELENWCRQSHSAGTVTFQESVSMLPALLLNVEAHHRVADLCAAPGSKTTHILDIMHSKARSSAQISNAKNKAVKQTIFPQGVVIANDNNAKRCRLYLAKRLRHLRTPCTVLTVSAGQSIPLTENSFDRVLVDVPCSGDGVLRKDPRIWARWKVRNALDLHSTQLRILKKGLRLLRPGGVLAYSTCSFNPLENEAVVCSALVGSIAENDASWLKAASKQSSVVINKNTEEACIADEYEIVESPTPPDGLTFSPGLTDWKVPFMCRSGMWTGERETNSTIHHYQDPNDAMTYSSCSSNNTKRAQEDVNRQWCSYIRGGGSSQASLPPGIRRSMFPATGKYARVNSQLKKCIRLLPHKFDGGGFFIALIRRRALPSSSAAVEAAAAPSALSQPLMSAKNSPLHHPKSNVLQSEFPVKSKQVKILPSSELCHHESVNQKLKPRVMNNKHLHGRGGGGCSFQLCDSLKNSELWHEISTFYGLQQSIEMLRDQCHFLFEGKRIILVSSEVAAFVSSIEKKHDSDPSLRAKFNILSAGMRIFLKMSPSSIRSATGCRWRPAQEGVALLGSSMLNRRLLLTREAMLQLATKRSLSVQTLILLAKEKAVHGWEKLIVKQQKQTETSDSQQNKNTQQSTNIRILAGGVVVGLLLQPSDYPSSSSSTLATKPKLADDCCWIACVLSSKELLVYANAVALLPIMDILVSLNKK